MLTKKEVSEGDIETPYETREKDFYSYELIKIPSNKNGIYIDGEITVVYVYKKVRTYQPYNERPIVDNNRVPNNIPNNEVDVPVKIENAKDEKDEKSKLVPKTSDISPILANIILFMSSLMFLVAKLGKRKDEE